VISGIDPEVHARVVVVGRLGTRKNTGKLEIQSGSDQSWVRDIGKSIRYAKSDKNTQAGNSTAATERDDANEFGLEAAGQLTGQFTRLCANAGQRPAANPLEFTVPMQ
jgi:hypothetical protein